MASASGNTVCLWDANGSVAADTNDDENDDGGGGGDGATHAVSATRAYRELGQHRARVWQLSSSTNGNRLVSASGDGTLKVWNTEAESDVSAAACAR